MYEELKQISAEMNTIAHRSEQDPRQTDQEAKERLEQLNADREALLSDSLFHGYGS
jgi:small-conductance mechanosensitive channel